MARNTLFHSPSREPLRQHPQMQLIPEETRGLFSSLNPTHARLEPSADANIAQADTEHSTSPPVSYLWRSRDNRKGRHTLVIAQPTDQDTSPAVITPPASSSTFRSILHVMKLMATSYPYWDISWWVAILFTLGSVVWVVNAFFVWQPLVNPWTEFPGEVVVAGGWSAFVGATIFEIGSVLLMIEAVNENHEGCFGWALESVVDEVEDYSRWNVRPLRTCAHHHTNRGNLVGKGSDSASAGSDDGSVSKMGTGQKGRSWQWFPSWHELTTHYLHELGFLACLFQLLGATIFWISGFTAIPQIQALLPTQNALDGAYWAPQIIGGTGFIISGILFMLETQTKWYIPAFNVLGWHIGFWNLVGALGFTLCGALGLAYASPGAQFEASLATFWGSWAFLIGSVIQWYEGLDKHPVEVVKAEKTVGEKGS